MNKGTMHGRRSRQLSGTPPLEATKTEQLDVTPTQKPVANSEQAEQQRAREVDDFLRRRVSRYVGDR